MLEIYVNLEYSVIQKFKENTESFDRYFKHLQNSPFISLFIVPKSLPCFINTFINRSFPLT